MIGLSLGVLAGQSGRFGDGVIMRLIELVMIMPRYVLLLAVLAIIPPKQGEHALLIIVLLIGCIGWTLPARLVRAEAKRLARPDYVAAARAAGASRLHIAIRHIIPGAVMPLLVHAPLAAGAAVLIETNLSFLGLGLPPDQASWSRLLADSIDGGSGAFRWWLTVFPGAAVVLLVWSLHVIGDALRAARTSVIW